MAGFDLPARGTVAATSIAVELPSELDALVIPVFSTPDTGIDIPLAEGILSAEQAQTLLVYLQGLGASGKANEITRLVLPALLAADALPQVIIAVGLGEVEELDAEVLRRAAGTVARELSAPGSKLTKVATTLGEFGMRAAVEGWILGSYLYTGLITEESRQATATDVTFLNANAEAVAEFNTGKLTAEGVVLTRDLVNTPANFLYPEVYAELIQRLATAAGVEVTVIEPEELRERGFGGVLAVGQGSARPPRVVQLRWNPENAAADVKKLALVGKGITFDTGGISLKPGASMDEMISDMGGSAAVVSTVIAAAKMKLPVPVTGTVSLAENMPSGTATRPGDIITHYGGITSQVLNTDAEGRLVLADAMVLAGEDNPDYLVETSTLTGAQIIALGNRTAGVMGSEELRDRLAKLGREVGETAWAMPLPEEVVAAVQSAVADIRNITTGRAAGMMAAGAYLSKFVKEGTEWAHIDIAGPSFNTEGAYGYTPKLGTGTPVRTFIALIEELAK
ncbi:leucyl aminopeptidase [Corynebacterium caspium]|uniref:leucyl aminopeptidase n=1 Tax=Corynebacterium caspium TaxID=234828 RepID=UPI00037F121C|nr:leucyl aminopeptidase [Corynebacterium caspium]WKD58960.1 Cytosol aminopeptidase [Corynebacterium caspium DSM 44850]